MHPDQPDQPDAEVTATVTVTGTGSKGAAGEAHLEAAFDED